MPAYSTPGVYVVESPLISLTTNAAGLSAAAFFGEAERGPTDITLVQDWNTYRKLYGELANAYDLGYSVYHYFANGGRAAYVRRIVNATAVAASAVVPFYPDGDAQASAGLLTATAISEGTWGNSITVQVAAGNVATTDDVWGTFTLIVNLGGVEVERWVDVSVNVDANRYVAAVINNYSQFIRVSNINPGLHDPDLDLDWYTVAVALAGGTQATVADSDYTAALTDLDGVKGNLILNAVGQVSTTVVTAFIAKAASRGDSFVIIDPDRTDVSLSDIQATAANFASISNGGYAAHYAPMLEMVDPAKTGSGARRTTFPGGAIAGLLVRTEVERSVAKAPAGFLADIRGALGLTIALTDANIGTLYDGTPQVNSFKALPGAGVTVWGARTLNKVNPDKFVNVRRTLNYLKYTLIGVTEFAVFEPNDERLWNSINMRVSSFLADFWRSGGLKGATASEAFFVVCDSTNNTASSIDQGVVNVEVGVALSYPAEFVKINLSQWTGGSNAVES